MATHLSTVEPEDFESYGSKLSFSNVLGDFYLYESKKGSDTCER